MKAITKFKLKNGAVIEVEAEGKNLLQCSAAATMRFISMYAMGLDPMDVIGVQTDPAPLIDGLTKEDYIARLIRIGWKETDAKREYERRIYENKDDETNQQPPPADIQ